MSGERLLIIGFGAFPRVPINPSGLLARRIAASPRLRRVLDTPPHCLVLRTAYAAIPSEFVPALAKTPDAVLMIGVAMRAKRIRVEFRARNRVTRLFPDADGRSASHLTLEPGGAAQRTSHHAAEALIALRKRGLNVTASRDAGVYLCNASYFRALAEGSPALFLHIPRLPDAARRSRGRSPHALRPLDAWTEAFVDVALLLLVRGRRQRGEGAFRPSGGATRA